MVIVYVVIALVVVVLIGVALSARISQAVRPRRDLQAGSRQGWRVRAGLIVFVPFVDRVHRVSLRIITMSIQSQGIITRDNVSVDISAVAYYRVADAIRSVAAIENASAAISQIAQTTLRAVVGGALCAGLPRALSGWFPNGSTETPAATAVAATLSSRLDDAA